ncbi:MAG: hypothetical protein JXR49_05895 [Acidobacteria bacterium]|nr:hypothetical protein [Acidobacteriota bacterium]
MEERNWKSILIGLVVLPCIILALFAAVRLPVMQVVRNNMQDGVDADAYFYTEVEGFKKYEEAISAKRHSSDRLPGR